MDLTAWLLFGIVALLIILAILALFAGWFPFLIGLKQLARFITQRRRLRTNRIMSFRRSHLRCAT